MTPTTPDPQIEQVRKSFQQALNRQGFGFQFSVLAMAENLAKNVFDRGSRSRWVFLFSEVPAEVQGAGTRIDFILSRRRSGPSDPAFYLICECKRANPALSNWCFIRAPRVRRGRSAVDPLLVDSIVRISEEIPFRIRVSNLTLLTDAYHLGIEVRAVKQGDSQGESGKAIEAAVTQVLRGLNGYLETLSENQKLVEGEPTYLLPVIFTTAQLWVSESNLGLADLSTGDIDLSKDTFKSVPWLWYQYHMSPGLKHSSKAPLLDGIKVEEFFESKYIRTVAIVSAGGVEEFLLHTSREFY